MELDVSQRGKEARSRIFGQGPIHRSLEDSSLVKPLLGWTEDSVWSVWGREGLDLKYRSLVVCTTLAALNRLDQLEIHLLGALRVGWTPQELGEALLQITCYAGAAAGADGFQALVNAEARFMRDSTAQP